MMMIYDEFIIDSHVFVKLWKYMKDHTEVKISWRTVFLLNATYSKVVFNKVHSSVKSYL